MVSTRVDGTLTGTTTLGQSGPVSNGNVGSLYISKISQTVDAV